MSSGSHSIYGRYTQEIKSTPSWARHRYEWLKQKTWKLYNFDKYIPLIDVLIYFPRNSTPALKSKLHGNLPMLWCQHVPSVQFSSVAQSCPTLCDPMNRSTPGLPVHHQLPKFTQTHVHGVSNAIQPSHPLSSPSPPALNLSQHQGLFQWASSSHQVAKVLEFLPQHQSFQWTPRTDRL